MQSKYEIGDMVLVKGSTLEIERVLTISEILIQAKTEWKGYSDPTKVTYGFKESYWHHDECNILRKV